MKAQLTQAVRSGAEALYYTKTVNCPICGKITEFTFLYFVVLETWRKFPELTAEEDFWADPLSCCGGRPAVKAPMLFELRTQKLLVFVTHGKDDGGAPDGAKEMLRFVGLLSEQTYDRITKMPYTIVRGWEGFRHFVNAIDGMEVEEGKVDQECEQTERLGFRAGSGYSYPPLFFTFLGFLEYRQSSHS